MNNIDKYFDNEEIDIACGEAMSSICKQEIVETFKFEGEDYEINLQKDSLDDDWYIIVTGPDGSYCYDGYWKNSNDKTEKEALEEAKRGAELYDYEG